MEDLDGSYIQQSKPKKRRSVSTRFLADPAIIDASGTKKKRRDSDNDDSIRIIRIVKRPRKSPIGQSPRMIRWRRPAFLRTPTPSRKGKLKRRTRNTRPGFRTPQRRITAQSWPYRSPKAIRPWVPPKTFEAPNISFAQLKPGEVFRFGKDTNGNRPVYSRKLRPIVIDGSNVAMEYGRQTCHGDRVFAARGIAAVVDFFKTRGHSEIVAFVPRHRLRYDQSKEPEILQFLERQGHVVFTPSREIQGRLVSSYDDRYIVKHATSNGGIIVSNDNYRDLLKTEGYDIRATIERRLLMFNFVGQKLMFPDDPLGRHGPRLDDFLAF